MTLAVKLIALLAKPRFKHGVKYEVDIDPTARGTPKGGSPKR
ncbi:MAG: hypothetical protein BAJALOKI3v1_240001, partial [Promethearchaeota archaeon]